LEIRERVQLARNIQSQRFQGTKIVDNSEMNGEQIRKYCVIDDVGKNLLKQAVSQLHLSARAYYRVLKLARTIADLAESKEIATDHLAEALQYRPRVE